MTRAVDAFSKYYSTSEPPLKILKQINDCVHIHAHLQIILISSSQTDETLRMRGNSPAAFPPSTQFNIALAIPLLGTLLV